MSYQIQKTSLTLFDLPEEETPTRLAGSGPCFTTEEGPEGTILSNPDRWNAGFISAIEVPRNGGPDLCELQKKFDGLHEEIYKKGGVKPTNAAIDELGKLIFLKIHCEKYPHYELRTGTAQGHRFADIFAADYVRRTGKQAIRELQDAFAEISLLPVYSFEDTTGTPQTIFPYQEALRLDHPDVMAMAIDVLSSLHLSVPEEPSDQNGDFMEGFLQADLLGAAYDVFLRGKYDNAGGLGTYLTPSQVVECMVRMAFSLISDDQLWARRGAPAERERWLPEPEEEDLPAFLAGDICCGTGRFLMAALARLQQRILGTPGRSYQEKITWLRQMRRHSLCGADQSASSLVKARINLLMYGEHQAPLLTVEDSILDENIDHLVGKFDLLLTNPPFGEGMYETEAGLDKMRWGDLGLNLGWTWKPENRTKRPLRRADPALLFIDRNLQLLKPGGVLLIVLPDGLLGAAYEYVHRYLFGDPVSPTHPRRGGPATLKAVVSLPREAFAISGTVAKTSFVCLQKKISPVENHEPVFMAVADHIGYLKKGTTEIPDPAGNDLVAIAAAYEALTRKDIPPIVGELNQQPAMVLVPEQDLEANLVPQSYHADRLRARSAVLELGPHCCYVGDLAAVQKPKQAMHSERTCYFISVLHLDEKSNVDWAAAAAHAPQSKGLICQPGEVLYSCINPAKVRVTVIPEDLSGEILCSTEFAILRAKDGVDPYYLALALKGETSSRQIEPLARGTSSSRRRIQECDLLNVVLPYPDATTRQDLAARFRDALEQARKAAVLNRDTLRSLNRLLPSKESTATS